MYRRCGMGATAVVSAVKDSGSDTSLSSGLITILIEQFVESAPSIFLPFSSPDLLVRDDLAMNDSEFC